MCESLFLFSPSFLTSTHSRRRRRRPRRIPRERRASLWHDPRPLHHHHARHGNNGTSTLLLGACVKRRKKKTCLLFYSSNISPLSFSSSLQSQKYERKDFGECPRMMCEGQAVVPVRLKEGRGSGRRVLAPLFPSLSTREHAN